MKNVTLSIPDSLKIDAQEAKMYLVEKLYEVGKISSKQAASVLGLSQQEFSDLLAKYGVSSHYPGVKKDYTALYDDV